MKEKPTTSFEKFNYGLRPAKNIERKMMADGFRRLSGFDQVSEYTYIGMGSLYFNDFTLFHRLLNFRKMISIESSDKEKYQKRFDFNKPFRSIDIKFGRTSSELPKLKWKDKAIVWLDYDGKIETECISDIVLLCANAVSGSFICFSVNVDPTKLDFTTTGSSKKSINTEGDGEIEEDEEIEESLEDTKEKNVINEKYDPGNSEIQLLEYLNNEFGDTGLLPSGLTALNIPGWNFAGVSRQIIDNQIQETLKQRNSLAEVEDEFHYRQIFNFHYEDGAKMLTVGGIIYQQKDVEKFERCYFQGLDFYRPGDEPYLIDPPLITFREVRELDKHMPYRAGKCKVPIPEEMKKEYSKIYRYFPTFTEAEI
jgi:hypothetical protein